jgi:hypothetical protein
VTVVVDRDDDVDTLARLRRLHARPLGRVVCEPDPTAGSYGLARHLLSALGKQLDEERRGPDSLWHLVETHLHGERVDDLILLRAHSLTFPALHQLALAAQETHLWLVVHQERLSTPVAQLLEAIPHETRALRDLLSRWRSPAAEGDDGATVPAGAGVQFPYLEGRAAERPRGSPRTRVARDLARAERAAVYAVWDQAHEWTTSWASRQEQELTHRDAADAIYQLARSGDTASEIYVRACAAVVALQSTDRRETLRVLDEVLMYSFGEVRPCAFNAVATRAAELADRIADPTTAALVVLSALCRSPFGICHLDCGQLAPDGRAFITAYAGGVHAVPPELRRYLATYHERMATSEATSRTPLFPGSSHGRSSQPAIRRALAALAAPASMWEDPADTRIGEGDQADGRSLLAALNPLTLWPGSNKHRRPNV